MSSSTKDNKFPVTEEREKELLSEGISPEGISGIARAYSKRLQEKSVEGADDYTKILYLITDYLGISSPDKRLALKMKKSDESCMRQRVSISQYQKKIERQDELVSEKEKELSDCMVCFEKRKSQMQETALKTEKLEEERQEFLGMAEKNPSDEHAQNAVARINQQLTEAEQELRKYERERNEFASKIVENNYFIKEAKNVLVSNQRYASALQKNYLRSRIERMRLSPFMEMGRAPIETIENIVQDHKIADETGNLADEMASWVSEITDVVAGMEIVPRKRKGIYTDLSRKYESSSKGIESLAERIIEEKRKSRYT